jgi:hypothetical protein
MKRGAPTSRPSFAQRAPISILLQKIFSMSIPNPKTEEFTRLFKLFERLAARRPRAEATGDATITTPNTIASDSDSETDIPAELAPVVHSLVGVVGSRRVVREAEKGGRVRSKTVVSSGTRTTLMGTEEVRMIDNEDAESLKQFTPGKDYTFTFRLMLHKLYQRDDWAQKVKEILQQSQQQFKPLAEANLDLPVRHQRNVSFANIGTKNSPKSLTDNSGQRPRRIPPRLRRHSISSSSKARDSGPLSPTIKSPLRSPRMESVQGDGRATKKRCVGRSKSLELPVGNTNGRLGKTWIYDAEVAAVEAPQTPSTTMSATTPFHLSGGATQYEKFARKGSSSGKLGRHARQVSLGAPTYTAKGISTGFQRRRVVSFAEGASSDVTFKAVKRPREF